MRGGGGPFRPDSAISVAMYGGLWCVDGVDGVYAQTLIGDGFTGVERLR